MIGSSRCVLVDRASAARPLPMAREPVSPMKICAGAAFHHKKPTMPPTIAAEMTARSSAAGLL